MNDDSRESSYLVVVNEEEQYSVWPSDRDVPAGWTAEGTTGSREHCLEHIGKTWTDMRPRSLRERMSAHTSAGS